MDTQSFENKNSIIQIINACKLLVDEVEKLTKDVFKLKEQINELKGTGEPTQASNIQ